MLYWILLVGGIVLVLFITETYPKYAWQRVHVVPFLPKRLDADLDLGSISALASIILLVGIIMSPIFWEYPAGGSVVSVDKRGTIRESSPFLGVSDLPWGDDRVIAFTFGQYEASVSVQPVTANPKVRHIVSYIKVRIIDPQLYLNAHEAEQGAWLDGNERTLIRKAQSALYEFHEKYSAELGKFYNPHDPIQQAEYYDLVISVVEHGLAEKGIKITGARFSM